MTIKRISNVEFQFECESHAEAQRVRKLKQFDYDGATYLIRKIVPGVGGKPSDSYHSFFVAIM